MNNNPARRVQLRRDLEHSRQQHQGKSFLVVKDPVTRRYFRFTETQALILELLVDEPVDAVTVAERASNQFGGAVSAETIEKFFDSLESKFLIDTPEVRDKLSNIENRKSADGNLLYRKLASINPELIFAWLSPRTRWAFTPAFQALGVLSILSGLVVSYLNSDQLTIKRLVEAGILNPFTSIPVPTLYGLLLIYTVVLTVTMIHEFSHGLTCCHFGGKVHEVGFMLIYFQPAFYCDVSDSWMFPSRRNRMLVTLAGGYIQLVVWGVCTIIWRITDTDMFINHIVLVVILFSGLQTLVNFNPLIKLDGYYMLSDWLEIPNLRAKAVSGLWERISGRGTALRPFREQRAQVIYGVAAVVFSSTLLVYIYTALYTWATSSYAFAGLVGFVMFSTYTLRKTATESIAGVRAVASRAALKKVRNIGIVAALLLVGFVGRWELKIKADFKIVADGNSTVRAETAGIIAEVLVREGSEVQKGAVLARLQDFDKQKRVSEIEGQLREKRSELALLVAGARPEEIEEKERAVETREQELANTRRIQEERNRLQQMLETRKSQLEGAEADLRRAQEGLAAGVIPRADVERNASNVKVKQGEIAETAAAIKALTETSDRAADLKTRELAEARSALRLIKAGSRPELIDRTKAEIAKLDAQLGLLKEELTKTEIRSPIDGIVSTEFVERRVNQYLASGAEFCQIVDTKQVIAEMRVLEKELADVKKGKPVFVQVRSFPGKEYEGRVDFIAPVARGREETLETADATRMVKVRATLKNEDGALKPEMTGVAKIHAGQRRIIDVATLDIRRWLQRQFWDLMP